jgi:hypothetical protein
MYLGRYVKYTLSFSDFKETWFFSTGFRKILKYKIFWRSVQWESSCSVRMDGRTDRETDGRTDKDDKTHKRFLQFGESVLKLRKKRIFLYVLRNSDCAPAWYGAVVTNSFAAALRRDRMFISRASSICTILQVVLILHPARGFLCYYYYYYYYE